MIGGRIARQPAYVGAKPPVSGSVEQLGTEQVARYAGDAVAIVLAAQEAEVAQGVGQAVVERAGAPRVQAAVQPKLDTLVACTVGVIEGARSRTRCVTDRHELVVHGTAIQAHRPVRGAYARAQAPTAANLEGGGTLYVECGHS